MIRVIKIGGTEISSPESLNHLLAQLKKRDIVVHGGGQEISFFQNQLGHPVVFNKDGRRITNQNDAKLVEMVLSGMINKKLVRFFINHGVKAIGISGADGIAESTPLFERTGQVTAIHVSILRELLESNFIPIISPVCHDSCGPLNVNADDMALAIAKAMNAQEIYFLSNVPGILINEQPLPELSAENAEALISQSIISGGMIPKVQAAIQAAKFGIPVVTIGSNFNYGTKLTI